MFHVFDRWGNPKPAPMTVLAARRTQNVDGTDNLDLLSDMSITINGVKPGTATLTIRAGTQ